eukprot:554021-Prymnesium_polylepis.2
MPRQNCRTRALGEIRDLSPPERLRLDAGGGGGDDDAVEEGGAGGNGPRIASHQASRDGGPFL